MKLFSIVNLFLGKCGRAWYENNSINWCSTIYFNFRQLPFLQAVKLPIYVYFGTNLIDLSGKIKFNCVVRRGMVSLGKKWTRSQGRTNFMNRGVWIVDGEVMVCKGTRINIAQNAIFRTGNHVNVRENCYIYVRKSVSIGDNSGIACSTQIMDSDFHFMIDVNNRQCNCPISEIEIGKNNWIGSFTTIKKGTHTPDNCIVASSYAVLSKDYTKIVPEYSILGGVPAKLISTGKRRVFNMASQALLSSKLCSDVDVFLLPENEDIDEFCRY